MNQHQPARDAARWNKPLLRGWLHAAAAVGAVIVTMILTTQTAATPRLFWSTLVFGLSMILLYGVSAIYHLGNWRGRASRVWRSFDHANIFVLIAGTYTPFCVVLLTGLTRLAMLLLLWGLALAGVGLKIWRPFMSRSISTGLYIGMGWIGVALVPRLMQTLPTPAISLLFAGGILYTLGGVIYTLRWPTLLPRIFSYHELFHLLCIAGNAAYLLTMWRWILPLGQL